MLQQNDRAITGDMLKHNLQEFVFLLGALCVVAGCNSAPGVAPVSGKVTLDGKPVANVHVTFQPLATAGKEDPGVGSYADTDAEGKYTLLTVDADKPGAVAGKHRVECNFKNTTDDDREPRFRAPAKKLPEKYNVRSELTFDVPSGGTTEANFDLKSK